MKKLMVLVIMRKRYGKKKNNLPEPELKQTTKLIDDLTLRTNSKIKLKLLRQSYKN